LRTRCVTAETMADLVLHETYYRVQPFHATFSCQERTGSRSRNPCHRGQSLQFCRRACGEMASHVSKSGPEKHPPTFSLQPSREISGR
jgi:hypothetical protein